MSSRKSHSLRIGYKNICTCGFYHRYLIYVKSSDPSEMRRLHSDLKSVQYILPSCTHNPKALIPFPYEREATGWSGNVAGITLYWRDNSTSTFTLTLNFEDGYLNRWYSCPIRGAGKVPKLQNIPGIKNGENTSHLIELNKK